MLTIKVVKASLQGKDVCPSRDSEPYKTRQYGTMCSGWGWDVLSMVARLRNAYTNSASLPGGWAGLSTT